MDERARGPAQMLVLLNSRASHGRAPDIWRRIGPELEARLGPFDLVEAGSGRPVAERVREALDAGERDFVAAGGDGTVNSVASALLRAGAGEETTLGAVGLGSSNDFHKRREPGEFVRGIPVRIDRGNAKPQDVIAIDPEDGGGTRDRRFAVMNASLGVTAEANAHFNRGSRLVRSARRLSINAAIVAAVLETLATFENMQCALRIDGSEEGVLSVSNLGVLKNPHFAGTFCYDTPVEPDDGLLAVNLCERLTRFQTLATLAALSRRRFRGRQKTRSWRARRVYVQSERPFALEADGEVGSATSAAFEVMPRALVCCA